MAAAAKPSHVVIAPADVFDTAGGTGTRSQQLPVGTVLAVVPVHSAEELVTALAVLAVEHWA